MPRWVSVKLATLGPIVLAGALSVPVIGRAPLTANEVATWSAASRPWPTLPTLLAHQDAVFTLYYAAMHVWLWLAGASPAALRGPSVVAALMCVLLTMRMGRRLTSSTAVGIAAGAFLAVNPFFLYYAIDARPYTFVAALAAATTALLLEPERRLAVPAFAALSLLGVWLQMMFLLVAGSQALALLIVRRELLRRLLPAFTTVSAGAIPLAIFAWPQRAQVNWLAPANPTDAVRWWSHIVQLPPVSAAALAALAAVGSVALARRAPTPAAVLVAIATVPSVTLVLVSAWLPLYDPRYVIESAPAISVLMAVTVVSAWRWLLASPAAPRAALFAGVVAGATALAMVNSFTIAWTHQHRRYFYEDAAGAALVIRSSARSGTAMVAVPGEARGALYYYLDLNQDGDLPVRDISAVPGRGPISIGNFSGTQASLQTISALARSYRRLVIVTLGESNIPQVLARLRISGSCNAGNQHNFGAIMITICNR